MTSPKYLSEMPVKFKVIGDSVREIHLYIVELLKKFIKDTPVETPVAFEIEEVVYRNSRWIASVNANIYYSENAVLEPVSDPAAKELDEHHIS